MKSVMSLRKPKVTSDPASMISRDAESAILDDDTKSVRSSATTASKFGGFLKNKLSQSTSFSVPRLRPRQAKDIPNENNNEDDEEYHENDATREAKVFRETTNHISSSPTRKPTPGASDDIQNRLRNLQKELDAEKLKGEQIRLQLETDHEASRKRIAELKSALERERENYQSLLSGAGVDEAVRMQAATIQELQALTEALELRAEQLETEYNDSERKCELVENAAKAESDALNDRIQCLETENATLKKFIAEQQQKPNVSTEEFKALERDRDTLRQKVLVLEAESARSIKRGDSGSAAEKLRIIEAENAELKRVHANETKNFQARLLALENELRAASMKKSNEAELAALQAKYAEKEAEFASLANGVEQELSRLDQAVKAETKKREDAEAQAASLQHELIKARSDLSTQKMYWKEKLEHDEHYQRAAEAAKQLLKQKKISKAEYDQVMKAAQEASRVWTQ